jgi:hypothetical protein
MHTERPEKHRIFCVIYLPATCDMNNFQKPYQFLNNHRKRTKGFIFDKKKGAKPKLRTPFFIQTEMTVYLLPVIIFFDFVPKGVISSQNRIP